MLTTVLQIIYVRLEILLILNKIDFIRWSLFRQCKLRLCEKSCKMDINVRTWNSLGCIRCGACTAACRHDALVMTYAGLGERRRRQACSDKGACSGNCRVMPMWNRLSIRVKLTLVMRLCLHNIFDILSYKYRNASTIFILPVKRRTKTNQDSLCLVVTVGDDSINQR